MKHLFSLAIFLLYLPLFAFSKNPSDYPLKVYILQQSWFSHNNFRNEFKGTGRGNIWEGASIRAFDYTYECSFGLRRTARNQPYLAKWKKTHVRLALLAPQIGKDDKYEECTLKTTIHDGIYILGGGGITEMSQVDYKEWKIKQKAAKLDEPNGGGSSPSTISKLSVSSTPDSAEIEVDGEFAGNTPSVLELDPGEHKIAVKKAGYKAWEKNIKLSAGEIKLNAELEPNDSN